MDRLRNRFTRRGRAATLPDDQPATYAPHMEDEGTTHQPNVPKGDDGAEDDTDQAEPINFNGNGNEEQTDEAMPMPAPNDQRFCRICYDDEDGGDMGYLFSPCLCKGSCALVHVNCLNTWRTLSSNENSAFKCDMCKYEYKLGSSEAAKLNFAQLIGYWWFSMVTAMLLLISIVVATGLFFEIFQLLGDDFTELTELELSLPIRVLSSGASTVGMVGFTIQQIFWGGFRFFFTTNDRDGGGYMKAIAILIGICYTYYHIYGWVNRKVREASYVGTLAILDVNGRIPGQRGPPSRPRVVPEVD